MSEPLVSIICEVYNHEPYLRQCLDGFVMQRTSFPFEILIHDDASTDGSAGIIKEYEAKHPDLFRPIYQQENQYSQGINIWFDIQFPRAKGKYIAICEGDDYWTDPLKLQKQVDFMENHSDYSLCFHKVDVLTGVEWEKAFFSHLHEGDYTARQIYEEWTIPTCSVLFRKPNKPFEGNHSIVYSDIYLWLQLAERGKVYCLDFYGGVYRRHDGGLSVLHDYSMYPRLAKQYRYMGRRFPDLRDISRIKEDANLKIVVKMPYFDGILSYRFRYMWLHPKLFLSYFMKTNVLSYTPLRHH